MALLVGENLSLSSNLELERRKAGRRERWLYNIVQICRGIAVRTLYIYHSILAIWETMMSFLKKSTILTNHYFIKNDRKSHCALYRSSTVEEEMLALHPVRWQLQSPQYSNIWIFFDISLISTTSWLFLQWGPPVSKVPWPHRPNVSSGLHV